MKQYFFLISILLISQSCHRIGGRQEQSYTHLSPHTVAEIDLSESEGITPKNVILMIGDGMGSAHVLAGEVANRGALYMTTSQHLGLARTKSSSDFVTDSSAGATAMATGVKVPNQTLSVDDNGDMLRSLFEIAADANLRTGMVSTCKLTHATPAAFSVHQSDRYDYQRIGDGFAEAPLYCAIGGGLKDIDRTGVHGSNTDRLVERGFVVVRSMAEVDAHEDGKLFAMIAKEHPARMPERGDYLVRATRKALDLLSRDDRGFVLMVEGSQIDWAGHNRDLSYLVREVLDFDQAVGIAKAFVAENPDTLLIVTADHETGGLTVTDGDSDSGEVAVRFSTSHHTGIWVPVFAFGAGAEVFQGVYENTAIFNKIVDLLGLEE